MRSSLKTVGSTMSLKHSIVHYDKNFFETKMLSYFAWIQAQKLIVFSNWTSTYYIYTL